MYSFILCVENLLLILILELAVPLKYHLSTGQDLVV